MRTRSASPGRIAPMLAAVAAGAIVFHPALGYFFSQDDFLGLARACGLAPRLDQPWRYIANQAIWDVLRPFGTTNAWPYHLASLVAHGTCVALLYHLLARRLAPWAALVGATFFAVHPSLFATGYWISTIGDPIALAFGLLALSLQRCPGRRRWLAVPLFALSLVSKETLLLLPAVAVAYRAWAGRGEDADDAPRVKPIDGTVIALAGVSLAYVAYFVSVAYGTYFLSPGDAAPAAARAPYALGWGANLWQNLLTYLGWSTVFAYPLIRGFFNAVDPGVYPWAIGTLAIWLAGLAWPRLRRRGWLFGGAAWVLFLLPALPLRNHTYHYYLYAPLAGAAWCVSAAAAAIFAAPGAATGARGRDAAGDTRLAWLVASLVAVLLTVNGALVVRRMETIPFVFPGLRADPIVDRARIAGNVRQSLAEVRLPDGVTLLFWSPIAASLGPRGEPLPAPAPGATYWEHNVRAALLEGLAVRVMFPQVSEVRFVREFKPSPPNEWYAVYRPDGRLGIATSAQVDSILRANAPAR